MRLLNFQFNTICHTHIVIQRKAKQHWARVEWQAETRHPILYFPLWTMNIAESSPLTLLNLLFMRKLEHFGWPVVRGDSSDVFSLCVELWVITIAVQSWLNCYGNRTLSYFFCNKSKHIYCESAFSFMIILMIQKRKSKRLYNMP